MSKKRLILPILLSVLLMAVLVKGLHGVARAQGFSPSTVIAAESPQDSSTEYFNGGSSPPTGDTCDGTDGGNISDQKLQECYKQNTIVKFVITVTNFLSAGVGVVIVIMVIIGGIQYSTAGGNPSAVAAAKQKIANALLALVAFIFMFSVIQWLVPGGIF